MSPLRPLAPDLFVADQALSFLGLPLGTRMSVVRLPGAKLFVHSPIAHSSALAAELTALGSPAHFVAPNRFHHLYVGPWKAAYPTARVHAAPALAAKRPDLAIDATLDGAGHPDWASVLDQVLLEGMPMLNEVVFFHRPSATLLSSDLVFNIGSGQSPLLRLAFRALGQLGRPSTTFLERVLVRDREAFRRSLARILAWPIGRIVLAHGDVFEGDGRAALREAYHWLLD